MPTTRGSYKIKTEHAVNEEEATLTTPSFNGKLEKFSYTKKKVLTLSTESEASTSSSPGQAVVRVGVSRTSTSSPSSRKRKRESSSYAPPAKYAHLNGVPDQLGDNLLCMMIGLNPGVSTAMAGHCYAAPSNLFWKLMYWGGLTTNRNGVAVQLRCEDDVTLPALYDLGTTNIVSRPTKNQAELTKAEMDASVAVLEAKIRHYKPEAVNIVGKAIWESIWRARHDGKNISKNEFKFGWQNEEERMGADEENGYAGARVFVVPSTSGLVAGYTMDFKKDLWTELGTWVNERRNMRKLVAKLKLEPDCEFKVEDVADEL